MKTVIVDDEKPSREALATYLRDYCPDVQIVAECDSVKSAFQAIKQNRPQLVFLDIELPNENGFDLLGTFRQPEFKVVFVTAYSDYAVRAFRFSAVDYLLKPVKVDELVDAVNKVREEIANDHSNQNLASLMDNLAHGGSNHHKLVIPNNKGFMVVNTSDLIMCQADGYITHFYLAGKTRLSSSKNLKHYEEIFDKKQFVRVHRSYLVNLANVTGYTHLGEIQLTDNLTCPLGDSYKQHFLESFDRIG